MTELEKMYIEEKAEALAFGNYDFPSFATWTGATNPREKSLEKFQDLFDADDQDLY